MCKEIANLQTTEIEASLRGQLNWALESTLLER